MSDPSDLPFVYGAEALLEELNARFALVQTDNGVFILDQYGTERVGSTGMRLLSKSDFGTLLRNRPAPGETRQTAATWWLQHPKRKEFEGIVFAPGGGVANHYNLWRGFPVQPAEGNCDLFWDLVKRAICADVDELYVYVLRWLAHLFQRPGELPETALVLRGKQGTGKTTFTDTIGHLVGVAHYLSVTNMSQVTGRFNGHLARILLLNANEAIWGGNRGDEGNLKAMITDRTIAIEYKGKDVIQLPNYKRLIVCSNQDWAVPMDADDRRFLVLDVDNCHKEDTAYFSALHTQLKNGGYEALMYSLLNEDLQGFNPRELPRTAASLDIKLKSGDAVLRWIFERLDSGANREYSRCSWDPATEAQWETMVAKKELFENYCGFCRAHQERHHDTSSVFFKKLRQMLPGLASVRAVNWGRAPGRAQIERRERQLTFPALSECRKQFERHTKLEGKIPWPPAD